jgi:hypothetical protein
LAGRPTFLLCERLLVDALPELIGRLKRATYIEAESMGSVRVGFFAPTGVAPNALPHEGEDRRPNQQFRCPPHARSVLDECPVTVVLRGDLSSFR